MALARGHLLMSQNVVIGNTFIKPNAHHLTSYQLPIRNQILLRSPQQPRDMGRAISTFCNKSVFPRHSTMPSNSTTNLLSNERFFSTQTNKPLFSNEVDLRKVTFGAPKKNQRGGIFVPITYDGRFLKVETPTLRTPFGITQYESALSMNASFDKMESDPKIKEFYQFISNFDKLIVSAAIKNAQAWFPSKQSVPSAEVIKANFKANIKPPKDDKYSELMKFKIPLVTNGENGSNADIEIYLDREAVNFDAVGSNSHVKSIIEPRTVWFVSGSFGVTWVVRQIKIVEQSPQADNSRQHEYSFRDDDIETTPKKTSNPNPPPPVNVESEELEPTMEEEELEEIVSKVAHPAAVKKSTTSVPPKVAQAVPKAQPVKTASKPVAKGSPAPIKSSVAPKKK